MRISKIVPFSVVILLITVSFAGVAAASPAIVGSVPTQLTAAANVTSVPAKTTFTIYGTLNTTGGTGISGALIQLQNSTDNNTWNNVTNATTDPNGNYTLSNNESALGTYYYRTTYAGYSNYYGSATSNVVSVAVIPATPKTTQLSAAATPASVGITSPFTIRGTLSDAPKGVANAKITLQQNISGVWTNVATNVTNTSGGYQFSTSQSAAGTYYYRATYAGNTTYAGSTSNVVNVTVTTLATTLTAAANVTVTNVSVPFTINGTLTENTSGTPISGATIQLQNSTDNSTWNNVTTNVTNAAGFYQFSQSQSTPGRYYYRTTYDGNVIISNAISLVVTVQVGIPTVLDATVNVTTKTAVNTPFAVTGTLTQNKSGTPPIPDVNITLQTNVNGTWTNVATTRTDSSGKYAFSHNESAPGTYQYRTTYAGNGNNLSPATSNVVTVQVGTTQLTAAANVTQTEINTNFTINGTLSDAPKGVANATIQLQQNVSGVWTNVTTNVTDSKGNYTFKQSEPTLNIYYYRTTYAGNSTYTSATSNVVSVLVNTVGATKLSAAANVTSAPVNTNFTINGTLNDTSGTPISGATITLVNNSTRANIGTTTTNANGNYTFSHNESARGTYYYYTNYSGYTGIAGTRSIVVNVTITNVITQLTAAANVTSTPSNTPFTINGTLNTTNGTAPGPIANAKITLQQNISGVWTNVATNVTNTSGGYQFSTSQPTIGTYYYRTKYAGNATDYYASATSNVVTVQVGPSTTLTAAANVTSTQVNTPFTINGTLNTTLGPLTGATVQLQNSTDNSTWNNVATTVTDANGNYSFSNNESAAGTHYYRTTYAGNAYIIPATSNVVTVRVGVTHTQLSAAANVTNVTANATFTINGTLTSTSRGVPGATIELQNSTDNSTWTNVTTNVTNTSGFYQFGQSESAAGTHYYRTAYDGNVSYANAKSNVVTVNVQPIIMPASSPAVANNLDLFVKGSDSALWWKHWNGATWSTPTSLSGVLTSAPAATSPTSGAIDVFARGSNGSLYEKSTTNGGSSWTGWTSLGGQIASGTGPAASSSSGRLDVFVQGTDGALWHKSNTGTDWSSWQSLSGVLTSSPGATSPSSSVIDVFVRGSNGSIYQKSTTNGGGSWSGWTSLGGQAYSATGPAASSSGTSRIDLFVEGTNGSLYQKTWTGTSWSSWQSLGGSLASSPAATSPSSGVIDVFVLGSDNGLWQKLYSNGSWSGWTSAGGL
jgi:5-hydroxyisourate hydrolase-like protein (transthyretin family)